MDPVIKKKVHSTWHVPLALCNGVFNYFHLGFKTMEVIISIFNIYLYLIYLFTFFISGIPHPNGMFEEAIPQVHFTIFQHLLGKL